MNLPVIAKRGRKGTAIRNMAFGQSKVNSMVEKDGRRVLVMVDREPVLTLWGMVVAEVPGGHGK